MSKAKSGLPTIEEITKPSKKPKKENQMKKLVITAVVSIVLTVAIVGAFTYTFFAGVNHEANKQKMINAKVESAVKQVSVQTSKQ